MHDSGSTIAKKKTKSHRRMIKEEKKSLRIKVKGT
jgi:hypothetical protein